MRVIVNGERKEISASTLTALLGEMEFEGSYMAIAVNCQMVPRKRWAETSLNDGDQVEIITPRQGG
jgi:sulfur carrier protein